MVRFLDRRSFLRLWVGVLALIPTAPSGPKSFGAGRRFFSRFLQDWSRSILNLKVCFHPATMSRRSGLARTDSRK
jgi:hypothetical protein